MKVLLIAVNAKYIHSNPAVYSLKSYAKRVLEKERDALQEDCLDIEIVEYTINQPQQKVLADICSRKADVLFFSCYIWNRRYLEDLVQDLGKIKPQHDIWIGGPEVSFDAKEALGPFRSVKGILRGEGEAIFVKVLQSYCSDEAVCGDPIILQADEPMKLDEIPFPYDGTEDFDHRIIYYESSRGCPFRCSYCLSSIEKSLRFRSMHNIRRELSQLLKEKVRQVKFVDRTFNCNQQHAMEIWRFLREKDNGITNFHFEIAGDLLTDEEISILSDMRPGQVQLEIGVQSTNKKTLQAINRAMDFDRLRNAVTALVSGKNLHLHLDLIAGLPYEDLRSFRTSFDDVFDLRPHQLQLGFLKVLKGSPMEKMAEKYRLKYTEAPPYEVLETKWISFEELMRLKGIEEMVEVYYNSGQFQRTIEQLLPVFGGAFEMFDALAKWYQRQGLEMRNLSREQRYEALLLFGKDRAEEHMLQESLIYDYYARENGKTRPKFLRESTIDKAFVKEFYSREAREHRFLTGGYFAAIDDPRLLRKQTHLEKLGNRYYLFDYTRRDPVTGNVRVISPALP